MRFKNPNGKLKGNPSPELSGPEKKKRDVSEMTAKPYAGASKLAPKTYRSAIPENPKETGVFASGKEAKPKGFAAIGVQKVPPGSLYVAQPLAGRPLF